MVYISLSISLITLLFGSGFLTKILTTIKEDNKIHEAKMDALMFGVQANLRDRLLQGYRHACEEGFMPYEEKEAWLNSYSAYHSLGKNGIMDSIKDKIMEMPMDKEHEKSSI